MTKLLKILKFKKDENLKNNKIISHLIKFDQKIIVIFICKKK